MWVSCSTLLSQKEQLCNRTKLFGNVKKKTSYIGNSFLIPQILYLKLKTLRCKEVKHCNSTMLCCWILCEFNRTGLTKIGANRLSCVLFHWHHEMRDPAMVLKTSCQLLLPYTVIQTCLCILSVHLTKIVWC